MYTREHYLADILAVQGEIRACWELYWRAKDETEKDLPLMRLIRADRHLRLLSAISASPEARTYLWEQSTAAE